jgi:hypothetical protein
MCNRSIATSLVRKCRSIRLYKRRRSRVMAAPRSNGAGQEFMIAAPNDSHRYLKKRGGACDVRHRSQQISAPDPPGRFGASLEHNTKKESPGRAGASGSLNKGEGA